MPNGPRPGWESLDREDWPDKTPTGVPILNNDDPRLESILDELDEAYHATALSFPTVDMVDRYIALNPGSDELAVVLRHIVSDELGGEYEYYEVYYPNNSDEMII